MGLGGPFGGYISDHYGWRWAFIFQLPLFSLSLMLTSVNLHYATPVSAAQWLCVNPMKKPLLMCFQGRGSSTKEILKRIDYGGSLSLLGAVSPPANVTPLCILNNLSP